MTSASCATCSQKRKLFPNNQPNIIEARGDESFRRVVYYEPKVQVVEENSNSFHQSYLLGCLSMQFRFHFTSFARRRLRSSDWMVARNVNRKPKLSKISFGEEENGV